MNTEITDFVDECRRPRACGKENAPIPAGRIPGKLKIPDWIPLIVLPLAVIAVQGRMPAWIFMWLLATAIFAGCKWWTWRKALQKGLRPGMGRTLGFLLAWPGMGKEFFEKAKVCSFASPPLALAGLKIAAGAALLRLAAGTTFAQPLVRGWVGMAGIVVFLHFGLFDLLAQFWRRAGVNAQPIMRSPLTATSLSEFWSARWNTAFSRLAHDLAFSPIARRYGAKPGALGVFLLSGLLHECVISLPARGGWGLPTIYFVVQWLGVLAERTSWGRKHLAGRFKGWLFVFVFTAGPAFWLFHPQFIYNVINPMLDAIGGK